MDRQQLIQYLTDESKVLLLPEIRSAFEAIDRADFLHDDYVPEAYEDYAVPIGKDQTIGKPTTTAFMLELLGTQPGEKVLNVGSGSGWSTALLAEIVGEDGEVWAVDSIPELVVQSQINIGKYNYKNVTIDQAGKVIGWPQQFEYDRILVNAEAEEIPRELFDQLKIGGVMVIPIQGSLYQVEKTDEENYEAKEFPGFTFSPLS